MNVCAANLLLLMLTAAVSSSAAGDPGKCFLRTYAISLPTDCLLYPFRRKHSGTQAAAFLLPENARIGNKGRCSLHGDQGRRTTPIFVVQGLQTSRFRRQDSHSDTVGKRQFPDARRRERRGHRELHLCRFQRCWRRRSNLAI